ncbi:MAG: SUMF1/EgtB/PvdO family nonheme iron enzyme [Acidobacteria bacterium]|nr:SUMF1/EgtB/PvdO family nonheme iron enzyme [Acidobacteriota bacterium]
MTPSPAPPSTPLGQLEAAWERSDQIFGLLEPEAILARPISLRQPFLFYVGHLPAFAWNHLWRRVAGRPAFAAELDDLFERGIDPPDDGEAPTDDGAAWPPHDDVLAYRDRVRGALPEILDDAAVRDVVPMVLEHELMHHETLLYMVQELPGGLKRREGELPEAPAGEAARPDSVLVPAGSAVLGAPRSGRFRWDNEHDELTLEVPAFRIDTVPVTNQDFRAFVEDGGYRDQKLWTPDGWGWIDGRGHVRPGSWVCVDGEVRVKTALGDRPFEEAAAWPVSVTHCEAAAYARWRDGRLPTEAEYHRAAFGTPEGELREHPWGDDGPRPEHGNLGFRLWSPAPVGSHRAGASAFGVHELVGNGWEWTSTPFGPLPGFRPLEGYEGYSADFFDDRHFVMLGGSWATDLGLVRRSFRNWFRPHYPYVFSKFRCVRDG